MGRKAKHEDHVNHEAWAIPYGDLLTLLLAFFVVMYSMSSVNEGKYRVLSDSLLAAFRGAPRTVSPIQVGEETAASIRRDKTAGITPSEIFKTPERPGEQDVRGLFAGLDAPGLKMKTRGEEDATLSRITDEIEKAMKPLIEDKLIRVARKRSWVEVEIDTDILFPSGSARVAATAQTVLAELGRILGNFQNLIRVEGHTDDKPISTLRFPSNWELSAARAAGVVRLFSEHGIDPQRMVVAGMGEHQPAADNESDTGRNRNRRVVVVVLDRVRVEPDDVAEMLGDAAPDGAAGMVSDIPEVEAARTPGEAAPEEATTVAPATAVEARG